MNILGIDTSTPTLLTTIQWGNNFFSQTLNQGLKHGENLISCLDHLLQTADISVKELDLVVCCSGPGSFTGLRVGMSTAKGLSAATSAPIISVSSLDLYGHAWKDSSIPIAPVIDARQGRFFSAIFRQGERLTEYLDVTPLALKTLLESYSLCFITGPGSDLLSSTQVFSEKQVFIPAREDLGESLLSLGEKRFEENGPDNPAAGPTYVREALG